MKRPSFNPTPWIVIAIVAFFFTKSLLDNWKNLDQSGLHSSWLALPGASLFILAVVASGLIWGRLLSSLTQHDIGISDAVRVHSASWLLKYMPGQVGSLINKLAWAKSKGISKKATVTSFVYENALTTLASLIVAIPLVFIVNHRIMNDASIFLPVLVAVPVIVTIYPPVFYTLLNFAFKKLGKKQFSQNDFLSTGQLLEYLVLYLAPRLLNAIGFVFIAASILPIQPNMYIALGSTYVLASIIGLLAVFVPGGIGVRESVIVLFVSMYFPVEQSILLAVVARLYATLSDIGVFCIYFVLNGRRVRQT